MVLETQFSPIRVLVRGGGDLGSGAIFRLHRAGFPVVVTEMALPLCVRRSVCYGMAVLEDMVELEGLTARRADRPEAVQSMLQAGEIPVLVDDNDEVRRWLAPHVLIDARMKKASDGLARSHAPLVVALGPGHEAGGDCHAVIETNRGHCLDVSCGRGQLNLTPMFPVRSAGIWETSAVCAV
jgi:xanthine dehydrogenase accessory factor